MKTKFLVVILFIILAIAYCSKAATIIVKISQFPNTTSPAGSDLFLLASGATNKNITWNQLKDAIGTNPATVTILNTLYATNIITTNLTVNNEFRGKTTFLDTSYITNLFLTENMTNYFLFYTNLFEGDTYVSNYFETNVLIDSVVSNAFYTNYVWTNIFDYSTNLTVNNYIGGNTYLSNYFQTNIITDSYNSNYFETNIFQTTVNVSSNYTYQYSINPTNLMMYGHTFMNGYEGDPNPTLILMGQTNEIYLDGGLGNIVTWGQVYGNSFQPKEVDWVGPTNSISHYASDYFYTTYTPVSLTGFTEAVLLDPTHGWGGLLTISNAASTNVLWTLPAGLGIPERTNQVAISNASRGMLSIKRSHKSGTNGVYRQF